MKRLLLAFGLLLAPALSGATGRFLGTSATLSTSAGSWEKLEWYHTTLSYSANSYRDDVNTTRYGAAFNPAVGATMDKVILPIYKSNVGGVVTVVLQENTGSWADVATASVTVAVNATNFPYTFGWYVFPLDAPATGTSNQWRVKVYASASGKLQWCRTSTAADYSGAVANSGDTSAPSANDAWLIGPDVTLTFDANATVSPMSSEARSIIMSYNSVFQWANPPAAPLTLNLGGAACGTFSIMASSGALRIGSEETLIPHASSATITNYASCANDTNWLEVPYGVYFPNEYKITLDLHGASPADAFALTITSGTTTSSNRIIVDSIPGSWVAGGAGADKIKIVGKNTGGGDSVYYKINSTGTVDGKVFIDLGDSTNNAPLNVNVAVISGGRIVNETYARENMGIRFNGQQAGNNQLIAGMTQNNAAYYRIEGVLFEQFDLSTPDVPAASTNASYARNCLLEWYTGGNHRNTFYCQSTAGLTVSNYHIIYSATSLLATTQFSGNNISVSNYTAQGMGGNNYVSSGINGVGHSYTDCVWANYYHASYPAVNINGSGHSFTNCRVIGGGVYIYGNKCTFNEFHQGGGSNNPGLYVGNSIANSWLNSSIGVIAPNSSADVSFLNATLSTHYLQNSSLGALGPANLANTTLGTYWRMHNYNESAGDHRGWFRPGTFNSSSGKLRGTFTSASETLSTDFNGKTNTISGAKVGVSVTAQMNDYTTYSPRPSLTVTYDGGTSSATVAAENNDAQTLRIIVSPTTDNNPLNVTLAANSSSVGETFDFSNLTYRARKYGKTFMERTIAITETLDPLESIIEILSLEDNPLTTEASAATVAGYSGIAIDHASGLVTVSGNHSCAELVDYHYYDLTQDANMSRSDWLTSIDGGITWDSAYDMTVDGAALDCSGKILSFGSKDFQAINGGSVNAARVTDKDGTLVAVSLSGVTSGSVYSVWATGTGVSIGSGTATGDVAINYLHTGDLAVSARVRKPGLLDWTGTGNVTVNGLTLNVSQGTDLNYNAAYDVGVSTAFVITASSISHTTGSNTYSARDLYSYSTVLMATTTANRIQTASPLSAQTPFDFVSAVSVSTEAIRYLRGGSLVEGTSLYANVYTVGSLVTGTTVYLIQDSTNVPNGGWFGPGRIDVLVKVKDAGTLIDSGDVSIFARRWGYTYDYYVVNLANGGRSAASISNAVDVNNDADLAAVSAYPITLTQAPTTGDIGDGSGAVAYDWKLDAGGATAKQVYQWLKWLTVEGSTQILKGQYGDQFTAIYSTYTAVKAAPLGTYAGGVFFGARGLWVENVDVTDALNYILTDADGNTHQAPAPPVSLTVTGIQPGSRLQIYNLTAVEEATNTVVDATSFSMAWTYPGSDQTFRIRLASASATSAYSFLEAQAAGTSAGMSYLAAQTANAVYANNNVDGSLVTECSLSPSTIRIYVDDPDNTTSAQRIYNWYEYILAASSVAIRDYGNLISATDQTHYILDDTIKVLNQDTANPLNITGANLVPQTGAATSIFDLSNGASIALNFNRVEGFPYSVGSGLSPAQDSKLMSIPSDLSGTWDIPYADHVTAGSTGLLLRQTHSACLQPN